MGVKHQVTYLPTTLITARTCRAVLHVELNWQTDLLFVQLMPVYASYAIQKTHTRSALSPILLFQQNLELLSYHGVRTSKLYNCE